MNLHNNNQRGFSIIEILLVIVFVGVIAYAWTYVSNMQDNTTSSTETAPETSQQVEINNADDLQKAEDTLNDSNLDELDTTELDEAEADLL